jgi:hypothetical protein
VGLRNEFFTAVTYGYRQGCKGYTETQLRELDVDSFNKLTFLKNVCKWFVDKAYSGMEFNNGLTV